MLSDNSYLMECTELTLFQTINPESTLEWFISSSLNSYLHRIPTYFFRYSIDSLLDIEKNMDQVTGRKKAFYEDQKSKRECRLSEEIDEELEEEKQELLKKEKENEEQISQEISFIMVDDAESEVLDDSMNSAILSSILNRSGLSRNTKEYSDRNVQQKQFVKNNLRFVKFVTVQMQWKLIVWIFLVSVTI